jgi:hypothetical protein
MNPDATLHLGKSRWEKHDESAVMDEGPGTRSDGTRLVSEQNKWLEVIRAAGIKGE